MCSRTAFTKPILPRNEMKTATPPNGVTARCVSRRINRSSDNRAVISRGTGLSVAFDSISLLSQILGPHLTPNFGFPAKAAAILNLDLGRVGGILEARKIAAMAEAHYLQISPHVWGGPIIAAASLQLDVCTPNFLIQESMETFRGLHAELLKDTIEWKNGFIIPSQRPGLGHDLN